MTDRFAHQLRLGQVRDGERIDLTADEPECSAIAARLGIEALDRLEAHATLSRSGDTVRAEGRLAASLRQSCVITGDPVAAHIDEPFDLLFMREPATDVPDAEIELGPLGPRLRLGRSAAEVLPAEVLVARAAARPAAIAAVEQLELAAESLKHDLGRIFVVARLVLPLAGLKLAFDVDLRPLAQIA